MDPLATIHVPCNACEKVTPMPAKEALKYFSKFDMNEPLLCPVCNEALPQQIVTEMYAEVTVKLLMLEVLGAIDRGDSAAYS